MFLDSIWKSCIHTFPPQYETGLLRALDRRERTYSEKEAPGNAELCKEEKGAYQLAELVQISQTPLCHLWLYFTTFKVHFKTWPLGQNTSNEAFIYHKL